MPLAESLEEDHAGRDGNIERFYRAGGRERDHEVATLAREFVQALAFAS
jgi:hypothetical protein